jgi:hypothetical protein
MGEQFCFACPGRKTALVAPLRARPGPNYSMVHVHVQSYRIVHVMYNPTMSIFIYYLLTISDIVTLLPSVRFTFCVRVRGAEQVAWGSALRSIRYLLPYPLPVALLSELKTKPTTKKTTYIHASQRHRIDQSLAIEIYLD